jgi:Asp-tRNA(Asn)/Glu-tRNA(Gln) amidotransferase C subunit
MALVVAAAELAHLQLGLEEMEQMVQHMALVAVVADQLLVLETEATEAMAHPEH